MAKAEDANGNNARQPDSRISAALRGARSLMNRSRMFRQVRDELSALTDAELNELGLSREMIRPVARQTAQAA